MPNKFQQLMRWVFTLEALEAPAPPAPTPGDRHPSAAQLLFRLERLEVLPEAPKPARPSLLRWLFAPEPLFGEPRRERPEEAEAGRAPSLPIWRLLFWPEPLPRDEAPPKRKTTSLLSLIFSPEKLPPGGD